MVKVAVRESIETSIYVCQTAVRHIPADSVSGHKLITCSLSEVFIKNVQAEMFIILLRQCDERMGSAFNTIICRHTIIK